MVFIPTYLYIKQHTITGKLYFGKSNRPLSKMLVYRGSGDRWKSHIRIHKHKYVVTLWYKLYDNIFDLVADSISMSKSFDIVNNDSWLNLKIENGLDGHPSGEFHPNFGIKKIISEETKRKLSIANKGNESSIKGTKRSQDIKDKLSKAVSGRKNHATKIIKIMCPDGSILNDITVREFCDLNDSFVYNTATKYFGLNKPYKGFYKIFS